MLDILHFYIALSKITLQYTPIRNCTIQGNGVFTVILNFSMNLGKLALYVTAIQSCCLNPRNFSGIDLVERLRALSHKQFRYNGNMET